MEISWFFQGLMKLSPEKCESLRTSFELVDKEPVQRVHAGIDFEVEHEEIPVSELGTSANPFR
jgi:hypothetical protein